MGYFTTIRIRIVYILNCLVIFSSFGQTLNFEHLSTKDGLPSTECYKVIQDNKGYVWVFCEYGIVKYNGERFVSVCTNLLVKDQNAYSVFQTSEGEIYFSNSFNKIFKIRNDSAFSIKAIENFTRNFTNTEDIIFQTVLDSLNNIYFSNYKGSYCYNLQNDNIKHILLPTKTKEDSLFYKSFNDIFFSFRSNFFNKKEFNLLIEDGTQRINAKISPQSFYEMRSLKKNGISYILTTSDHIYKISKNESNVSNEINCIIDFAIDKKKQIWICSKNGLFQLDSNLNRIATYLEGKIVGNVCFDDKGGIWATTIGDGVYHCRNKEEIVYSTTDLKTNEILFIKKEQENIYFSSLDGTCYRINNEKKNKIELVHHFNNKFFCEDISEYKEGLIFTTKNGIFYKKDTNLIKELKGPKDALGIYSNFIEVLNDDEFLIFGGTSVYHFKDDLFLSSHPLKYKLYSIARVDNENFLLGTKNGIYLYNCKNDTDSLFNNFFANKFIMKLIFDPAGNLWVATRGDGLFIVNKKKQLIKYTNLPFFVVKDIDFFDNGGVIVSTNLGIYVNKCVGTNIVNDWVNIFDDEVNSLELADKKLWIASRKGLYSIDFSCINKDDFYPIIINSVYAGTKKVLNNTYELKYNENDLRFNFDFLNYQSRVKNFYFKLEGPTQLSGTIAGNVLQIQNLAPGQYKLDIFPYHGPVYSNMHFVSQFFVIRPAFWQTNWFKFLVFLLVVCISGFAVALIYTIKRKRDKKHNEIQQLLAEHKLTALKAQINPHFISNSLAAIQLLIDSGEIDNANQYLAKFSLFIRYVLKYSDKSVSKLSDELKIIELNVELEQLRFSNSFVFNKIIANDIDIFEIYVPPLITQPFIENAIWHGLSPLKLTRIPELVLKVQKSGDSLLILIIDNGVGRNKSYNPSYSTKENIRESMGTILTEKRIENLNQLYNTKTAEIKIVDLFDAEGFPSGTCVTITLPISLLKIN